jgi:hypothetical protein
MSASEPGATVSKSVKEEFARLALGLAQRSRQTRHGAMFQVHVCQPRLATSVDKSWGRKALPSRTGRDTKRSGDVVNSKPRVVLIHDEYVQTSTT